MRHSSGDIVHHQPDDDVATMSDSTINANQPCTAFAWATTLYDNYAWGLAAAGRTDTCCTDRWRDRNRCLGKNRRRRNHVDKERNMWPLAAAGDAGGCGPLVTRTFGVIGFGSVVVGANQQNLPSQIATPL